MIGGGFVGAEVASTAYALGLEVTVVEAAPTPLAAPLGQAMGSIVSALHLDHGVRLLCGVGVKGLSGERKVEAVLLEDGRSIPADLVVVGVGALPCVDWLEGSGVALDNGVKCGADGRTSLAACGRGRRLCLLVRPPRGRASPRGALDRRTGTPGGGRRHPAGRGSGGTGCAPAPVLLVGPVRRQDPVCRSCGRLPTA